MEIWQFLGTYLHKKLGLFLDSSFKIDKQVRSLARPYFWQNILLLPYISITVTLYVGIEPSALNRLQLVQNAAARFPTDTKKSEHITGPFHLSLVSCPVYDSF